MKVLNAAPLLRPLDSGRPVVTSSPLLTSIRPAFRMRRGSARVACDASVSEKLEVPRPLQPDEFMRGRMEFLRKDLEHLFDERGIDKSAYEEKVKFRDPLTRYNSVSGYLLNIQFLRFVFGPKFTLHDLRLSGEREITSRWTMRMKLQLNQISPFKKWWDPELLFTGVSIMAINPETGKFMSHIDYWDAIENQQFPSFEAVKHLISQLTTFSKPPAGLDTPDFIVLRKFSDCEVRRYDPFVVAETDADVATDDSKGGGRRSAFRSLARYIFGEGNERGEKMSMTTPVFTSETGRMQFVVGKSDQDISGLPKPTEEGVDLRQQSGGNYACISFSGVADEASVMQQVELLQAALPVHGLKPKTGKHIVARYNDPSTKAIFRRNDILIELQDFELW